MGLLDLPAETQIAIVHELVNDISINEAWELRTTCRAFRDLINVEIFRDHEMDSFLESHNTWPFRRPSIVFRRDVALFLAWRTRKLLDANADVPSAVKHCVKFLLDFEPDPTSSEKQEELTIQLCQLFPKAFSSSHRLGWWQTWEVIKDGFNSRMLPYYPRFHKRPTLTSEQRLLADKLTAAALMGNHTAISKCLGDGAKMWWFGFTFGHTLTATLLCGRRPETVLYLLEKMPRRISRKHNAWQDMVSMFNDAFESLFHKKDYTNLAFLFDWCSKHLPSQGKDLYNDWLRDAISCKDHAVIKAALSIKTHSKPKVTWNNFENCAISGDALTLELLINNGGFDIHRFYWNQTTLTTAVRHNNIEQMQVLLDLGVDPNGPIEAKNPLATPLKEAVKRKNIDMVDLLFKYGATTKGHFPGMGQREMILRETAPVTFRVGKQGREYFLPEEIRLHRRLKQARDEEDAAPLTDPSHLARQAANLSIKHMTTDMQRRLPTKEHMRSEEESTAVRTMSLNHLKEPATTTLLAKRRRQTMPVDLSLHFTQFIRST